MKDEVWDRHNLPEDQYEEHEPFWKKYGYPSYEAMIEAKTGTPEDADLSDWPMPEPPPYPADDEDKLDPELP